MALIDEMFNLASLNNVPFLLLIINAILLVPCALLFQAKFVDTVRRILTQKGICFVISYARSEEASLLSDGYESEVVTVNRSFAGFVKKDEKPKS